MKKKAKSVVIQAVKGPAKPNLEKTLVKRKAKAQAMAASKPIPITIRLPEEFNQWLDAYRHLSFPTLISKQDLILEALIMGYICRGNAGEEIIDIDLVLKLKKK